MIPKEILPFYTHLATDPGAPAVYVNLSTFYRDEDKPREFKYNTDQQGYSLLYQVGVEEQQTVEVFPPYRYTYGMNRLEDSVDTSYDFDYLEQLDPQTTVGVIYQVTAPESILSRACGVTASVTVTGLAAETLYIGNFINESREIIFTSNPINLNVDGLLFLYVVRSRDGTIVYQPGTDYTFDQAYQSITFTTAPELYTPIVVDIAIATLDSNYEVITSNGTYSLPAAFSYGVAVTGAQAASSTFSTQVTWTSVIDHSELDTNYVLALSDETGCKTLASSSFDNIIITDVNALVHRTIFKDFTDVIRASTPVPVESETSLAGIISYEEVEIESASVPGYNERRTVTFDLTIDNPVEVASLETEAYSRAGAYENGVYRAGSIRSLPQALGVSEIEDSVLNNNQVPAVITPTFKVAIPADNSGLLAKYDLTADMDLMNPVSAAWGLLLAASYNDSDLILLNLKALVYQAKQRGWIKLEGGQYVIDNTVSAGLPINFSTTDKNYEESFKEVGSNAFLGWAACYSILSLTDDQLRTYYAMQGSNSNFYSELLLTLEAMAFFVANGVSRVTWLAAYKEEAGSYSYDEPSLSATVYADTFLSYFLALRYSSTVHYVAAKLDEVLNDMPRDVAATFFSQFYDNEVDYLSALTVWSSSVGGPRYYSEFYYDLIADKTNVGQGEVFTVKLDTSESNFPYAYTITGVDSDDIDNALLTGVFAFNNEIKVYKSTSALNKNFIISLNDVNTSAAVSLAAPLYTLTTDKANVIEGDNFTITFNTNAADLEVYPYTISGVTSEDIDNAPLTGLFTSNEETITFKATVPSNKVFAMSLDNKQALVYVNIALPLYRAIITATAYGGAPTEYWDYALGNFIEEPVLTFSQFEGGGGWRFWALSINGGIPSIWDDVAFANNKVAFTGQSSYEYGILNPTVVSIYIA